MLMRWPHLVPPIFVLFFLPFAVVFGEIRITHFSREGDVSTIKIQVRSPGKLVPINLLKINSPISVLEALRLRISSLYGGASEVDLRLSTATAEELNYLPLSFYQFMRDEQFQQLLNSETEITQDHDGKTPLLLLNTLDRERLDMLAERIRQLSFTHPSILRFLTGDVLCMVAIYPVLLQHRLSLPQLQDLFCLHRGGEEMLGASYLEMVTILRNFMQQQHLSSLGQALWQLGEELHGLEHDKEIPTEVAIRIGELLASEQASLQRQTSTDQKSA